MLQGRWSSRLSLFAAGRKGAPAGTVGVHAGQSRLAAVRLRATASLPTLELLRQSSVGSGGSTSTIRALAQEGFFAGARVFVTLPGGKYDTITITSPPAVPEEELREALRWQLRGALSYAPEDATFDFVRLPQASRAERGSVSAPSILIVAAHRRDVAQALAPFQAAGVPVDAVDIPELAQRNLLGTVAKSDACEGFLSFDDTSALLTVQLADELCFARRMQLPGVGRPEEDEPEHTADRIATNVQRSLEVFARQSQMPEVASVTIGTHPHASLIARAITEQATVATTLFDPATVVALGPNSSAEFGGAATMAPELMLALGTALRNHEEADSIAGSALSLPPWLLSGKKGRLAPPRAKVNMTQNVNLLEPTQKAPSRSRVGLRRAAIAAVLVAALTSTIAALQWRSLENARAELARVRAEAQRLQREQIDAAVPDPVLVAQITQDERDVAALELIAHQLTNGSFGRTQGFADELRAFGRATASGIWLTGLKLDNPTNSMTLDGKAVDASRVPALIHALESEPHFSGTRFASIELHTNETEGNGAPRTVAFRIATPVSDLLVDAGKDPVHRASVDTAPVASAR